MSGVSDWSSESGAAVDERLHVLRPLAFVEPQADALAVRLGIKLANSADVTAVYRVEEFTFRVAGISFPMSAEVSLEQLAPGAEMEWWREMYPFGNDSFPVTIEVDYRVGYGDPGALGWRESPSYAVCSAVPTRSGTFPSSSP